MADSPKYRTAYEEALANIESGKDTTGAGIPRHFVAADTLNTANGNQTFLEAASDVVDSIPKFIATSLISGANQLYNAPADIGNLFGADIERSDTAEVITSLDSNLGEFYKEHREGVDTVGFLVSSLIPGTAGVKVLNAGQKSLRTAITAGKFGENTGKALGLLAPQKQEFINKAVKEIATNSSTATLLNNNALKAIGSGLAQNTLEALAFETAVTATLFNSPVLENQDMGDFVANVALGAGIFGVVGGALDAVKIRAAVKVAGDKAAVEARPWTFIEEAAEASTSYEKLALDYEQLAKIPTVPEGLEPARKAFLEAAAETKATRLNNRIRKELAVLTGGDQEAAEVLFQAFKGTSLESQHSALIGMVEATKLGARAKIADRVERLQARTAKGTATIKEMEELLDSNIAVSYAKAWGEDVGRVTSERPTITALSDTLGKGERIEVSTAKVIAGKETYPFDTVHLTTGVSKAAAKGKKGKAWNILKVNPLEANARYIWAAALDLKGMLAKKGVSALHVDVNDIPLMEKVMLEFGDSPEIANIKFLNLRDDEILGTSLKEFIGNKKVELANKLLRQVAEEGAEVAPKHQEEIAAIVNVKNSFLNGDLVRDPVGGYSLKDILALQDHAEELTAKLVAQGARKAEAGVVDIWNVPQHIKMTYDTTPFKGINNFVLDNMVIIKEQQKLYQQGTSRASASVLGEDYAKLPDINSGKVFSEAVPSGAGSGFVTAASSNYGSLASLVENIGGITSRTIEKFKDRTRSSLEPLLYKLANNQEAAVEWSSLNQRVRSIEGEYALNEAGTALEPLVLVKYKRALQEAAENGTPAPKEPVLRNPAMELEIPLKTPEVRALARAHIELNGKRTAGLGEIRSAQGVQYSRDPEVFYPIPVNPKDYKHFAMVTDESITSGNPSKTLFATSAEELDTMIRKLKENPHLKIRTKKEAEEYYSDRGQWDYEKTLNANYLDTEAHRKGVSAPFIVATDPAKITSDTLTWHMQRETGLVREAVAAKYEVQFNELRRLGDEATNVATSQFSDIGLLTYAEDVVKNPFADYIKTALGIRKNSDYPWWVQPNQMADQAVSKLLKRATLAMEKAKTPAELAEVNRMLEKGGYKGAAYDETMALFSNVEVARGALSAVVQKANSILATIVLRLDALNSVNNAVSANVLLGTETKAVIRAIQRGDTEAIGALGNLTRIKVPGTEETIFSPQKLIGNAIKKFNVFGPDSTEMKFYRDNGYITSISAQYRDALDSLTFTGKESVANWDNRINKLHTRLRSIADTGEKWTGNKLAEEFNRFVAADVMKQMTDIAVERGLMTAKEQLSYINTFVNRTQGNYLAAQRPMLFQGPIGQAIGLFQTYQFNLIQQLLRHVGEGHSKDAMTLLALQGTIHGMSGLPAFNAINTHIVGTASGNTEHKDAYTTVYGIAGKEGGDWLMYGGASNMLGLIDPDLKVNLYTRGDINPRHVTIVPTNPATVPIVQASGKFFANLFGTAKQLAAGGDVSTTLLQGLEHNSISRPLAGLAQALKGLDNPQAASYATTKKGNVIAANDLLSLANLTRLAGGKPMDEAVAMDAVYRYKAYALADQNKRNTIGRALKSTMIGGAVPTQEQIEEFAGKYAEAGGRQEDFAGWMTQLYKSANLSQVNKIRDSLHSPYSQSMQLLMRGRETRDFTTEDGAVIVGEEQEGGQP